MLFLIRQLPTDPLPRIKGIILIRQHIVRNGQLFLGRKVTVQHIAQLRVVQTVIETVQGHKVQDLSVPALVLVLVVVVAGFHQVAAELERFLVELAVEEVLRGDALNRVGVEVVHVVGVHHQELDCDAVVVL